MPVFTSHHHFHNLTYMLLLAPTYALSSPLPHPLPLLPFKVQYFQFLQQADLTDVTDVVEGKVQLLQTLKGCHTIHVPEAAPADTPTGAFVHV